MLPDEIPELIPEWILRSSSHYLVITDLEGKYIFTNNVFNRRFSFLGENFIGVQFQTTIHPDDIERCNLASYQCMVNPDATVEIQVRKPQRDADDFYWTHWEFSAFKDKGGQTAGILCLGHDISESERASQRAKVLAEKIETIIENITDGLCVINRQWRFVRLNKVAERAIGRGARELMDTNLWDVFADTSEYNYPAQLRRAMDENVTVHFEEHDPSLSRWFAVTAYPSAEGLTVFFRENTQEHRALEQLQYSENKLRAILDSTTDVNILISPELKVLSINDVARKYIMSFHGVHAEEGDDFRAFIQTETAEIFYQSFAKALAGEQVEKEWELKTENLSLWFYIRYYPVHDKLGKVIGVSFNCTDIDAKKRAEEKLRESEYIMRAIYESSTDAKAFISPDYKLVYFNRVAGEMVMDIFGEYPEVGYDYSKYILPHLREEFRDYFDRVLHGETIQTEQTDGQRWYLFSLFPVYDQEGKWVGVAENVKDITQRKQSELKIISQNEKLKAIMWQQSHEVRRPVANIMGLVHLIQTEKESGQNKTYLEHLLRTTEELDEIIRQIVSLSTTDDAFDD